MEFNGTFACKIINRVKGEKMTQDFRRTMKVIYIASCAAYVAEIAKQVPVLTGASRRALAERTEQLLLKAIEIDGNLCSKLGVNQILSEIDFGPTLAKTPHTYPTPGSNKKRTAWANKIMESGQSELDWLGSDSYCPCMINVGSGNAYSGKFSFFFGIKSGPHISRSEPFGRSGNQSGGWYLEYYDEGTINAHDTEFDIWGDYGGGAWNLHNDGQRAFNLMFTLLFERSGVKGMRAMLPVTSGEAKDYSGQISMFGTTVAEEPMETIPEATMPEPVQIPTFVKGVSDFMADADEEGFF